MEKQRYSLRMNIGFFLNKPIGYSRDFRAEFPEIFIEPDLTVFNFESNYRFSRTREGLLLQAKIAGEMDLQCGRCLEISRKQIHTNFEELFVFAGRSQDETDLIVPEDGYINLAEVFRDYILLDIPMNYVCDPNCKGVCTICGQNLNQGDCEHTENRISIQD